MQRTADVLTVGVAGEDGRAAIYFNSVISHIESFLLRESFLG